MWIVFSIEQCMYCKKLKELLYKMKVPFLERSLQVDERPIFISLSGKKIVPQFGWTMEENNERWLKSISKTNKKNIQWFSKEIKKVEWLGGYTEFINMLQNIQKIKNEVWFKNWTLFQNHFFSINKTIQWNKINLK